MSRSVVEIALRAFTVFQASRSACLPLAQLADGGGVLPDSLFNGCLLWLVAGGDIFNRASRSFSAAACATCLSKALKDESSWTIRDFLG
jgi:hypothetical protein